MAGKSKAKKPYKPKAKKNVKAKKQYKSMISYVPVGLPQTLLTRLRYSTEFSINTLSTNPSEYVFRANGLQDPDYSGVGHQPMQFDQIKAVYNRYTVLGSKINVKVVPTTTTAVIPCAWGIALVRETPTIGNMSGLPEIMENPRITRPRFTDGLAVSSTTTKYNNEASSFFSAKKFFSVSKKTIMDDYESYGALISSDPVAPFQAWFEVWTCPVGGNDPGTVSFVATVEYMVMFRIDRTVDQS